ncbi:MAG TPA: hypothetical protein VGD67_13500, partial [Pseudonocardiaceae bacterium]
MTVTQEERHQSVLARYPAPRGVPSEVAVELGWCVIAAGKYRGRRAIEVRLDGHRVGELTHLMSERYAPMVDALLARGARPGCEAEIERGAKGLQLVLRLPRHVTASVPAPRPEPTVVGPVGPAVPPYPGA